MTLDISQLLIGILLITVRRDGERQGESANRLDGMSKKKHRRRCMIPVYDTNIPKVERKKNDRETQQITNTLQSVRLMSYDTLGVCICLIFTLN